MAFDAQQMEELKYARQDVCERLEKLKRLCVVNGRDQPNLRVREYLLQGAGRRAGVLKRTLENIFQVLPPDIDRIADPNAIADAQINLHSFLLNLYGIFDNWAWAYLFKHNLLSQFKARTEIGMFKPQVLARLPNELKDYLSSESMTTWYNDYLKQYRDALAHRIPVYIPPSVFSEEESTRYVKLEEEKLEALRSQQWLRIDEIYREQDSLGGPCLVFLHSLSSEEKSAPIQIHPQLVADARAVADFGEIFFNVWESDA